MLRSALYTVSLAGGGSALARILLPIAISSQSGGGTQEESASWRQAEHQNALFALSSLTRRWRSKRKALASWHQGPQYMF